MRWTRRSRPRSTFRGAGIRPRRPRHRARPRRRRSRRSPTTRSCPTATPARWSPRTAAIGWLCVPRFDSPSVFGTPARPAGRLLPARAVRDRPPDRADVRAGHEHPGHHVEDADRLDRGPGRADHGPTRAGGRGHPAHPAAGRRRRRPHAGAHRPLPGRAPSRSSWSASRCSTTAGSPARWTLVGDSRHAADATGAGQTMQAADRPRARRRGRPGPGPARAARGRRDVLLAVLGGGPGLGARTSRRPTGGWTPPPATGAPGWAAPACPTTAGGTRSSARRWSSRA